VFKNKKRTSHLLGCKIDEGSKWNANFFPSTIYQLSLSTETLAKKTKKTAYDGVSSIGTSSTASSNIVRVSQYIYQLSLAFISPLRPGRRKRKKKGKKEEKNGCEISLPHHSNDLLSGHIGDRVKSSALRNDRTHLPSFSPP
jgi:hypothetical protein